MSTSVAAIVLAAGGSSRLGAPKQLLRHQGVPLIRRAAECALAAGCHPVIVVLGAQEAECRLALEGVAVTIVSNPDWPRGIGTSVRGGASAAAASNADAACVLVCDQPHVTAGVLSALLGAWERGRAPVVASRYAQTVGSPALFSREAFAALLALPDDAGAKRVIEAYGERAALVDFAGGAADIDAPDDLRHLR